MILKVAVDMRNKLLQFGFFFAVLFIVGFVTGRTVDSSNAAVLRFRSENMRKDPLVSQSFPEYYYPYYREASDYGYARSNIENEDDAPGLFQVPLHRSTGRRIPSLNLRRQKGGITRPDLNPGRCTDSDDDGNNQGKDIYTKGILRENEFTGVDYCKGVGFVMEHFCENGRYRIGEFTCIQGCFDGACLYRGTKPDVFVR